MHPYLRPIATLLNELADASQASPMKAYMKNQFNFLGIKTPTRRSAFKEYMKLHKLDNEKNLNLIVAELWEMNEREYQYCAIELAAFHKKLWSEDIIILFEHCITTKSWWDTVDFIGSEWMHYYFKLFPDKIKPITDKWNKSANIWLQRSSLLFQKSYKKDTDLELLSTYIINLASSKEFFIQKAIGWMLREYAKTDAEWVKDFVSSNSLAPLSKREALKNI
jgi:3-methyladenine DNA glycosylase AlkD